MWSQIIPLITLILGFIGGVVVAIYMILKKPMTLLKHAGDETFTSFLEVMSEDENMGEELLEGPIGGGLTEFGEDEEGTEEDSEKDSTEK